MRFPRCCSRRRCFAALSLALAFIMPSPGSAGVLEPCRVAGIRNEVLCGSVSRALDPARPAGVKISVHYVVLPAEARRKLPDPVFLLAGGPGQSAIKLAPSTLELFARLNSRRDIVFVDQRGTGRSAPLECDDPRHQSLAEQADPQRQFAHIAACRERLKKLPHGDLRFYTTPIAMQDLDAVRKQLDVEQVNLIGASYGTRAALDYLRQFPHTVRRLIIDAAAPPDRVLSGDGQLAFDALLSACENEAECRRSHPKLRADWAALLRSLPRSATAAHPLTGHPESFTLTREMVLRAVRGPLFSPPLAAALPQAITEAVQGRYEALLGLHSLSTSQRGTGLAMGAHFSVVCAEDYPRLAQASDPAGTDFGRDFAQRYERVCTDWPRGELPAAFYSVPPARAPVLLLSGGLDPATPRHGKRTAQELGAHTLHEVVSNAGHDVMSIGCMSDVLFRFIDAADDTAALAVDAGCAKSIPRPPAFRPLVLEAAK
jgi:pimeloyl-ACP methyl ester carboxylesterase